MQLYEIKRAIFGGESATVEFKHKVSHPEKVVREVVAFANTNGGHLFVGVDDNRNLVGLKHAEEEDFILRRAITELCSPSITYQSEIIPLSEKKSLLHYHIPAGNRKPYYARELKSQRYGKAYVRVEDRSVQASREMRRILKFQNNPTDVRFEYGENERILFNFLASHGTITLPQFRELTGLDYETTSALLVRMVTANALRITPRESLDWYSAAN